MTVKKSYLPTEADFNRIRVDLESLRLDEASLEPEQLEFFRAKLKSAQNEVRVMRASIGSARPEDVTEHAKVLQKISEDWSRLGIAIGLVEDFYDEST